MHPATESGQSGIRLAPRVWVYLNLVERSCIDVAGALYPTVVRDHVILLTLAE